MGFLSGLLRSADIGGSLTRLDTGASGNNFRPLLNFEQAALNHPCPEHPISLCECADTQAGSEAETEGNYQGNYKLEHRPMISPRFSPRGRAVIFGWVFLCRLGFSEQQYHPNQHNPGIRLNGHQLESSMMEAPAIDTRAFLNSGRTEQHL